MPTIDDLFLEKKRYGLDQKISYLEKLKLKKGMPVQKILGYIEMSDITIKVNKKILIPRYETEELVEIAKQIILKNKYTKILDMCTGSGYIGIALKKWNPLLEVVCVDIDKNAISQTKINSKLNNVHIEIIKSNLFEKVLGKFDLIISNPPYIDVVEKRNMSNSVLKFEPHKALFANDEGMFFYKKIEKEALNYISENGKLLFEINPLKEEYFTNKKYVNYRDINGKVRFSILNLNLNIN